MSMMKMMQQAQLIQGKMEKELNIFHNKVFEIESENKLIKIKIKGDKEILKITINDEIVEKDSKDILEDYLMIAINEALLAINDAENDITAKFQNQLKGFGGV